MKRISLAAAIAAISGSVFAAGAFDGPYVQAAIGGAATETKASYSLLSVNGSSTPSGGSFLGQILGGYSQSFDRFNLAANVFYNIGDQDSGSYSATGMYGSNVSITGSQSFTMKNTWGVSIEPGGYITDSTLGYFKLSYYNSQLNYNATLSARNTSTGATASTSGSSSNSMNGIGYGLGVKQMLTKNVYGLVEYQYVQYDTWNDSLVSYKPNQNYGWIGIGYKF